MIALPDLPTGLSARAVTADDVAPLAALVDAERRRVRGSAGPDVEAVRATAVGIGSWTRRQVVVTADDGRLLAWAGAHDRAAGRTDLVLHVDRTHADADAIATGLLGWLERSAAVIARGRDLPGTLLETVVSADDARMQGWLGGRGFAQVRTWLNMTRPVAPGEELPGRDGVRVRRVGVHDLGDGTTMPVAEDLQAVHRVLERSFEDHFNSYRESFGEFVQRLREDAGHRWDHWWLATVEVDGVELVGGAIVCTVIRPRDGRPAGSYVEYIGVDRLARGRGVAKALLAAVVTDAAARGRDRVGLEVDADSPTGADGLYRSLGWETDDVTQSWQRALPAV